MVNSLNVDDIGSEWKYETKMKRNEAVLPKCSRQHPNSFEPPVSPQGVRYVEYWRPCQQHHVGPAGLEEIQEVKHGRRCG